MDALAYKSRVTVVDVLDAGACIDGVKDFVESHGGAIAGNTSDFPREHWIQKAANADGRGDGDGYGYGYGDGDGDES